VRGRQISPSAGRSESQQQLTTQAETVSRALDMSEKLVDVLIDQDEARKTECILIVDGRLTMQACCMHVMMMTVNRLISPRV